MLQHLYSLFSKNEEGSVSKPSRIGIIISLLVSFAHSGFHRKKIQVCGLRAAQESSVKRLENSLWFIAAGKLKCRREAEGWKNWSILKCKAHEKARL